MSRSHGKYSLVRNFHAYLYKYAMWEGIWNENEQSAR